MPRLTLGMASYDNYKEVWFTVQALRMFHDLTDTEILIIDNFGCPAIKDFVAGWVSSQVRYELYTERQGTAAAKNRVFEQAAGDWVLCIDSHVMLVPGAVARLREFIAKNPEARDLFQGPLIYDNLVTGADSFSEEWSGGMWGQWNNIYTDRSLPPYEIPMMGMGLFGCRKDAWLGFNPAFRGFGGEEGYIHQKFKKHGRKTICLPWLQWLHQFQAGGSNKLLDDMTRNYVIGFQELGLDMAPLIQHRGADQINRFLTEGQASVQSLYDEAVSIPSDINEHLPTLAQLSAGKRVTEFGVRSGVSTIGWLQGRPQRLTCYDINPCPREAELVAAAAKESIPMQFILGDSTTVDIEPTDILFIDTLHTAAQLALELARHADQVYDMIVLHDTAIYGWIGDDGTQGLNVAVREFLREHPEWGIQATFLNNNGLTVLQRGCVRVSCICPTYNRVVSNKALLEEAVESFLRQDYPNKELVIINDCPGQMLVFDHPQVAVINSLERYATLGEKYNAGIQAVTGELICTWEDDDISLPHRLSLSVAKLGAADYFNPKAYFFLCDGLLTFEQNTGYAHNCSLYRKEAWARVGGYPAISGPQDAAMDSLLRAGSLLHGGSVVDDPIWSVVDGPISGSEAFFIYRWGVSELHLSGVADTQLAYDQYGEEGSVEGVFILCPAWREDYVSRVNLIK
jgi:glycosyltransferase involved in cell wall biosynthesis/predicted O-methyltransferase YrrM